MNLISSVTLRITYLPVTEMNPKAWPSYEHNEKDGVKWRSQYKYQAVYKHKYKPHWRRFISVWFSVEKGTIVYKIDIFHFR